MGCCPVGDREENLITGSVDKIFPGEKDHQKQAEKVNDAKDFKIQEGMMVKETKASPETLYEEVKVLGEGSFGQVKKVKHKISGEERAMKEIRKDKIKLGSEEEKALINEINVLKSLDHPNIMKVFEYFNNEQSLYIVSELLSGGELFDKISDLQNLSEDVSRFLMKQIFSAVAFCHNNDIIHRDLKPENILIESAEEAKKKFFTVKIIDFGTSNKFKKGEKCDVPVGTPLYTAPEVIDGKYDEKCDVWSCGVIMYMMLCGKQPFTGDTEEEIYDQIKSCEVRTDDDEVWDHVSDEAKDLIKKLLVKNPKERYTAKQSLEHKWFVDNNKGLMQLDKNILEEAIRNIRLYSAEKKIQQASLAYIVHNLVHKEDVVDLRNIFIAFDANGDGRLDRNELISGFNLILSPEESQKEVERLINIIDVDGNGFIEYEEFLRASLNKDKILTENNLESAFRLYDIGKRGKVNALELKNVLGGVDDKVDDNVWKQLIEEADLDKDGEVDFNDFQGIMKQC